MHVFYCQEKKINQLIKMSKSQTKSVYLLLRSPTQEISPPSVALQLHSRKQSNSTGNSIRPTKPLCVPVLSREQLSDSSCKAGSCQGSCQNQRRANRINYAAFNLPCRNFHCRAHAWRSEQSRSLKREHFRVVG